MPADKQLTVMSALHPRLGADSWLNRLDSEILKNFIVHGPNIIETKDIHLFRAWMETFKESEEERLEHMFSLSDAALFGRNKEIYFQQFEAERQHGLFALAKDTFRVRDEDCEEDEYTDELTLTICFKAGVVYFHFIPESDMIIIDGLGFEDSEKEFGEEGEGIFLSFLELLRKRVL
jgi:hypothetical protein